MNDVAIDAPPMLSRPQLCTQALLQDHAGPCIVAHFAYEGDPGGAALDEYLASLASEFLGTRFVRHVVQPGSTLPRQFGLLPGPGEARSPLSFG
jgi:hypothetical protein